MSATILRRAYRALVEDIERVRGQVEIGMRFLTAIENVAEPNGSRAPLNSHRDADCGNGPAPADGLPLSQTAFRRIYGQGLPRERELRDRQRAKLALVREAL